MSSGGSRAPLPSCTKEARMSANVHFKELAMRKLRRVMTEGSIVEGPSREVLFDGLKYCLLSAHEVSFKVAHPVSPDAVQLRGRIFGIEQHSDNTANWLVKIEVVYVCFDGGGFSGSIDPVRTSAFYSTKRRTGHFL